VRAAEPQAVRRLGKKVRRLLIRHRVVIWILALASLAGIVAAWLARYAIATPITQRTLWYAGPLFLAWGPIGSRTAQGVDISSGVAIALVTGAVASAIVLTVAASFRRHTVNWQRLVTSVCVAFLVNSAGVLCALFLSFEGGYRAPAWLIIGLGAVLMPGVWAITALGRFDAVQYLAGITFNMVVWSAVAYAFLKERFVRAA
jgi:hypothetical protein